MSDAEDTPLSSPQFTFGFILTAIATAVSTIPAVIRGFEVAAKYGPAPGYAIVVGIPLGVIGVLWFAGRATGAPSFATGALIGGAATTLACGLCVVTILGH
jgi:hypothetical protein